MKKYVLTGGSACGKTTLIGEFRKRGFRVVDETARKVLETRKNLEPNYNEWLTRQSLIAQGQYQAESVLDNDDPSLVFLDRGFPDIVAYSRHFIGHFPSEIVNCDIRGRYDHVFILDRLPFQHDGLRVEKDDNEAETLHSLIIDVYNNLGYRMMRVPVFDGESLDEKVKRRADFILNELKKMK
jgi:predicted ATPase